MLLNAAENDANAEQAHEEAIFLFQESLDYVHIQDAWVETTRFLQDHAYHIVVFDFRKVKQFDSSGIALLRMIHRYGRQHRMEIRNRAVPARVANFLHYIESESLFHGEGVAAPLPDPVTRIGGAAARELKESYRLIQFIGEFFTAVLVLFRQRRFRWKEWLYYAQASGSEAMPVIFLMSFLIGLVMAFQAAIQLRQFGANIYVADLLSLAITRELGPVFTAVILAGRSGSSFAAEIGTMKVNEEIDALTVMGIDVTGFLVLPKVFALAVTGPLLTIFADASAILGGIVVGIFSLELTAASFMTEVYHVLTLRDVLTGILKSFVFAVLIALIGCLRGLQTETGAVAVGRQTTSAVVSGIFLIIAADAVFTVIFHVFSW